VLVKPKVSVADPDLEAEADGPLEPNRKMQNATLQQRIVILNWYHAHGKNQSATERHFRCVPKYCNICFNQPLLSKWLKNEAKWHEEFKNVTPREHSAKCVKQTELPDVTKMMDLWVTKACNEGVQLTGDILREKWRDFEKLAGVLEDERLKLSNGWLDSLKKRLGLKKWKRHGESGSADPEVVVREHERVHKLLQESGYEQRDIFNMDETGLFYT
jgi:hypothetical protein